MNIELPKQSEVLANKSVYGDPRRAGNMAMPAVGWQQKNLVLVPTPYQMRYAGKIIKGMTLHRHCAPLFASFLDLIWQAAKQNQKTVDQWGASTYGGGFNFRLMRGGNQLSMHSYGCAIDLDPANNGLKDATPRFLEFPELIKAIRASGLVWGADWNGDGKTADTRTWDGMHFQATQPVG